MNNDSLSISRAFLAQFFPKALHLCTDHYRRYMAQPQGDTAKDIKEHHVAGKATVAHLSALLKLIDQCNAKQDTGDSTTPQKSIEDILALTRATLMNRPNHESHLTSTQTAV